MKKCFMMEPKQKATWAEIDVGALVTPDFVKACIRFVSSTKTKTLLSSFEGDMLSQFSHSMSLIFLHNICISFRVVMCCMRLGDCQLAR